MVVSEAVRLEDQRKAAFQSRLKKKDERTFQPKHSFTQFASGMNATLERAGERKKITPMGDIADIVRQDPENPSFVATITLDRSVTRVGTIRFADEKHDEGPSGVRKLLNFRDDEEEGDDAHGEGGSHAGGGATARVSTSSAVATDSDTDGDDGEEEEEDAFDATGGGGSVIPLLEGAAAEAVPAPEAGSHLRRHQSSHPVQARSFASQVRRQDRGAAWGSGCAA